MTSPDDQSMVDHEILDLFRSDMVDHKAVLEGNLLALKDYPGAVDRLGALATSAFAVRGAAQIVGLDKVAGLAGAVHGLLGEAVKGVIQLESKHIDLLIGSVKLLGGICDASDEEVLRWPGPLGPEYDDLCARFAEVAAGGGKSRGEAVNGLPAGSPPRPAPLPSEGVGEGPPGGGGTASPPEAGAALPEASSIMERESAGAALPAQPAPPKPDPFREEEFEAAAQAPSLMLDPVMLDIFRTEVASNTQIMSEGLLLLESESGIAAPDTLDSLMRAAHSIKGAGRIVDLDPVVKISHAMEDCFVAARRNEISLLPEHIDVLLKSIDVLVRISNAAGENPGQWQSSEFTLQIDELVDTVRSMSTGKSAPKKPVPSAPPPPAGPRVLAPETGSLPATTPAVASPPSLPAAGATGPDHKPPVPPVPSGLSASPGEAPRAAPSPPAGRGPAQHAPESPHPHAPQPATPVAHASPRAGAASVAKPGAGCSVPGTSPSSDTLHKDSTLRQGPMIRVGAAKIERLIGLAGEVVVNTRWLPMFSDSLFVLKRDQTELFSILEQLQEEIAENRNGSGRSCELIRQARDRLRGCGMKVADRINRLNTFISSTTTLSERLYQEAVGVRMRPFASGTDVRGLPRMVRDLARSLGKRVKLEIVGRSTEVDRDILERLDAPLNHLLRNAVDHGIETPEERRAAGKPETGSIRLQVEHRSGMLMIRISDDGRGIDMDRLKQRILRKGLASRELMERLSESELMDFLFLPGFSTAEKVTEISGRGVGLDVVHSMVHEVGGVVRATSKKGEGITFHMELPLTLSVIRTLLVKIADEAYAFPLARIETCLRICGDDIQKVEDRRYFRYNGGNIALVKTHRVLDIPEIEEKSVVLSVVVVSDRADAYGMVVDDFLGECDLVVRPLDRRLGKVTNFSAAALLLDGTPVLIFDVDDLVCSINNQLSGKRLSTVAAADDKAMERAKKRILVVDDSITVRELERKMLENKGYQVEVAVDGMDGWNAIRSNQYDMIISDVDMPRMNGIELITQVRQHPDFKALPVIIISYKDNEEDKLAGLQAGANYYLTKSSFQDHSFIEAVVDLIGEPDITDRDN